jgi:prepilin-type N-terminal cleavage/methylation domain-containing protein
MRTIQADSRRRQRGFSLIEALAAATLLAVTMMALNMTSITLARGTKIADSASVATALGQERLEALRSLPRGHAQHTPGNYDDPDNPLTADGQSGGIYTRRWRVSANDLPDFGLRTVVVRVSWNGPDPHSLRLVGFVRCATVPCT